MNESMWNQCIKATKDNYCQLLNHCDFYTEDLGNLLTHILKVFIYLQRLDPGHAFIHILG